MSDKVQWYKLRAGKRHKIRGDIKGNRNLLTNLLPGQICQLTDRQFHAFRDKFEGPITTGPDGEELVKRLETATGLTVHDAGGGWFDVIDAEGNAINDKKMREDAAHKLVEASLVDVDASDEDDSEDDDKE